MDHPQESAKSGLKIFGWNMEIVIAVLLSFVAIVAIIASRKFPGTGLATDIGSARFPLIYSIVLVVLCVILISQNLAKRKHTPNEVTASDVLGAEVDAEAPNYRRTFFGVVSSVFCLGAMDYFGYLLTTTIYLSFLMWLL
ncbi:MAG: tripartite tricarboxylate transporter TctB family protein [Deltaproteobacteria bacterium]|nr:tripartite tricarboxylate transporter TctB family protein [Deltaproteobacteria bacterium]